MYDIIVVGGGPGGLTAAVYGARAGKSVLVLEKNAPGGQILSAPVVDNYPAAPHISGADFAQRLSDQVTELGVEIELGEVTGIDWIPDGFRLRLDGAEHTARAVILATGARHRTLGLPGEEELTGMGVSYCAICDGPFYTGCHVAVAGGGNTALEEALFLADCCEGVTLIHRRDSFRGEERLAAQLGAKENVTILYSHQVEALRQENGQLTGLTLRDGKTGAIRNLDAACLFVAVGLEPDAGFAENLGILDASGYIRAGERGETVVPGIFAAGDCRTKRIRQLTTAVADGANAALGACAWLDR